MSESVEIKPGYWRTRDGEKAEVVGWSELLKKWIGALADGGSFDWHNNGRYLDDDVESGADLVELWVDVIQLRPGKWRANNGRVVRIYHRSFTNGWWVGEWEVRGNQYPPISSWSDSGWFTNSGGCSLNIVEFIGELDEC